MCTAVCNAIHPFDVTYKVVSSFDHDTNKWTNRCPWCDWEELMTRVKGEGARWDGVDPWTEPSLWKQEKAARKRREQTYLKRLADAGEKQILRERLAKANIQKEA